jgi:hypothetical protein
MKTESDIVPKLLHGNADVDASRPKGIHLYEWREKTYNA